MHNQEFHLHQALIWYCKDSPSIYSCGHTYESLDWSSENKLPKPSLVQLEVAYQKYLTHLDNTQYQKDRAKAYPPIQDQLDMIYREGLDTWMQLIYNIKSKYPNPKDPTTKGATMKKTATQEQIETLGKKIDELGSKTASHTLNTEEVHIVIDEVKAGLFALKGFMMQIPAIQKQLEDIKEQLKVTSN